MENPYQLPKLIHPEVEVIYKYDLNIPSEKIKAILQLPRKTLIEDLITVLYDSINRYEFFKKRGWEMEDCEFPKHALWLLADLKAEEALPDVLNILRQDNSFLVFWYNDFLTENFHDILYHIANNSLEELKSFSLEAVPDWGARIAASTTVVQIAILQPEQKDEIIKWYRSVFEQLLAHEDDDPVLDVIYISFLICEFVSLKINKLLPLIKQFYDRDLVSDEVIDNYEFVEKNIHKGLYNDKRIIFNSIFERYKSAVTQWHNYLMKYSNSFSDN